MTSECKIKNIQLQEGLLSEGFLHLRFEGLTFGWAYFRDGSSSKFYLIARSWNQSQARLMRGECFTNHIYTMDRLNAAPKDLYLHFLFHVNCRYSVCIYSAKYKINTKGKV